MRELTTWELEQLLIILNTELNRLSGHEEAEHKIADILELIHHFAEMKHAQEHREQ